MKAKKRYFVEPCDNFGTITPAPPRDRTWIVRDRRIDRPVAEYSSRVLARAEAATWVEPNETLAEFFASDHVPRWRRKKDLAICQGCWDEGSRWKDATIHTEVQQ